MILNFKVNDTTHEINIDPSMPLADVLHDALGYKSVKQSCSTGICGACTIRINGEARKSCLHMAGQVADSDISTVEGLSKNGALSPLQEAFIDNFSFQCGFCTPGFLMSTAALLAENSNPSDEEIRDSLHGNICRCTGYLAILDGVKDAANRMNEGSS